MALEVQVLNQDRNKNVAVLNRIMEFQTSPPDNWISNINADIKKKNNKNTAQIQCLDLCMYGQKNTVRNILCFSKFAITGLIQNSCLKKHLRNSCIGNRFILVLNYILQIFLKSNNKNSLLTDFQYIRLFLAFCFIQTY